jgi:predicted RNase H-like nuclease (RuvC/YqgF family)
MKAENNNIKNDKEKKMVEDAIRGNQHCIKVWEEERAELQRYINSYKKDIKELREKIRDFKAQANK